jgi:Methyltransferase domain
MDRTEKLMQSISKADKLIEVGPSLNPLAPKADGWNSYSIDHADQAGLREKYKNDPSVDPLKIERVDFVWTQGSLSDAVATGHVGTFDVFLASHVIEHFPNVVDFLNSAEKLTNPQGRMVLAVPDKRLCFDMFRSLSSTGEAIAAHLEKRARHTCANVFDFTSKAVIKNGLPGWVIGDTSATQSTTVSLELAHTHALAAAQDAYIDAHSWVFCPASFQLMMVELARLGYTDWRVDRCEPEPATEFHAWFSKGAIKYYQSMGESEFHELRNGLLKLTILELAEQSKTIVSDNSDANIMHDKSAELTQIAILQAELNGIKSGKLWRLRHAIKRYLFV